MGVSIGKAAQRAGISVYTLRYYDKEGLLPFVDRSPSGTRCFKESDFEWLGMIQCLKNTGMTIRDIHEFVGWCMEGDSTIQKRLDMFRAQKKEIQSRMMEFQRYLDKIDYKINYYENAVRESNQNLA
jgi:DNA-binding transcriptional MerR regulator